MEPVRVCRNTTLKFIRRTRALLLVVIATAVITTLLPLTTGPARAATALPANESVLALRADQVNRDSGLGAPGCKILGPKGPDTGQQGLLAAVEAAREAGVAVSTEQRAADGTTVVSFAISGPADPAIPSRAASDWWIYETFHGVPCGGDSTLYIDFSAKLNTEMVKAAAKNFTKISQYLGYLTSILGPLLSHGKIGVIIGIVGGLLGLAGMNLVKFYKYIRGWLYNARHKRNGTGWYADVNENLFGDQYESDALRSCVAGWWELKCGTGGKLVSGSTV